MGGTSRANNQWSKKCHQANVVCFDHLKTVHSDTFSPTFFISSWFFTARLDTHQDGHLLDCPSGLFFLLKWCLISLMAFCDIVYQSLHCENVTTNGRFMVCQSSGCFQGTKISVNIWKSLLPALLSCTAMMPLCFCLLILLLPTNVHMEDQGRTSQIRWRTTLI